MCHLIVLKNGRQKILVVFIIGYQQVIRKYMNTENFPIPPLRYGKLENAPICTRVCYIAMPLYMLCLYAPMLHVCYVAGEPCNVSMPRTVVFDSESNSFTKSNQFGKPSKSSLRRTRKVNDKTVNKTVFAKEKKPSNSNCVHVCACVIHSLLYLSLSPKTAKPSRTSSGKDQTQ